MHGRTDIDLLQALKDHITHATGVDVSEGMVEEYNSRMKDQGIANASAVIGNFLSETATPSLEECHGFTVAAVGLGFHHFHNSALVLRRLAERVRPGGVVLILDWLPSNKDESGGHKGHIANEFEQMKHTIAHDGFDREMMRGLYEDAGMVDYDFVTMDEPVVLHLAKGKVEKIPFLSRGRVPAR